MGKRPVMISTVVRRAWAGSATGESRPPSEQNFSASGGVRKRSARRCAQPTGDALSAGSSRRGFAPPMNSANSAPATRPAASRPVPAVIIEDVTGDASTTLPGPCARAASPARRAAPRRRTPPAGSPPGSGSATAAAGRSGSSPAARPAAAAAPRPRRRNPSSATLAGIAAPSKTSTTITSYPAARRPSSACSRASPTTTSTPAGGGSSRGDQREQLAVAFHHRLRGPGPQSRSTQAGQRQPAATEMQDPSAVRPPARTTATPWPSRPHVVEREMRRDRRDRRTTAAPRRRAASSLAPGAGSGRSSAIP